MGSILGYRLGERPNALGKIPKYHPKLQQSLLQYGQLHYPPPKYLLAAIKERRRYISNIPESLSDMHTIQNQQSPTVYWTLSENPTRLQGHQLRSMSLGAHVRSALLNKPVVLSSPKLSVWSSPWP
jgi:hypothetical protein